MTKQTIAFLGLGRMGMPMAHRVHAAGYPVTVWNRTPDRAASLAEKGVPVAESVKDAVVGADIVITMLADADAVHQVLLEAAPAFPKEATLIEASSIGPDAVVALIRVLPAGVNMIDAPVMGSVDRAADGTLVLLAGGDVTPVLDVLELFGTVTPCGPLGSGAALKVVLIGAVVSGVMAIAEAVTVAHSFGLPEELVVQAMANSPLAGIAARAFGSGSRFALKLAAKDVALALDRGDLPVLRAVHDWLTNQGDAREEDLGAVVTLMRTALAH